MKNNIIVKKLENILEKGWLLVFLFSPLFFATFLNGTWQVSEALFFQVLVEILFGIYLVKIILLNKINHKADLRLLIPIIGFFIVLIISTIISNYPFHSFWGDYLRKMGFLLYSHVFLFFLILFLNLKNIKQVVRIGYATILSTIIVSGYGILQFFELDPLNWAESPTAINGGRLFSTLGQPNFLASWLLFAIPILAWLVFKKGYFDNWKPNLKKIFIRPALVCLFFITVLVLVLSQSRGGWLGFLIAFFFFIIVFSFIVKQKRLGKLLSILFLVLIIFVTYININPLHLSKSNEGTILYRIKSLSHLSEKGELRFMWWQDALGLIKEKPFFGYGLETQKFNFRKSYHPKTALLEAINSYPDRIHNDILDTLYASGFVGLFFYVFLIILAFYQGAKYIKKTKNKERKVLVLSFMAGILGYLISIQFSFHVAPTIVYFFGFLAILIVLPNLKEEDNY